MNETGKRIVGYGAAAVLVGGLVYGGFIRRADPDLLTMISSVDVQLRLASVMPERDRDGKPIEARERMLRESRAHLDTIDRVKPDYLPAVEFRAYLEFLEGKPLAAAALYERARGLEGCTPEVRDTLILNEAKAYHAAGRTRRAIALLEANEERWRDESVGEALLEKARMLSSLERSANAANAHEAAAAAAIEAAEKGSARVAFSAGMLLERWGRWDAAAAAYRRAAEEDGRANYFLARLKIKRGEPDKGLALLARAARTAGRKVTADLVDRDGDLWKAVGFEGRIDAILSSENDAVRRSAEEDRGNTNK